MTEQTPNSMEQFMDRNGRRIQVLCTAQDREGKEPFIVYQELFGTGRIFAVRKSQFSECLNQEDQNDKNVDRKEIQEESKQEDGSQKAEESVNLDPKLVEFLDAKTMEQRLTILSGMRDHLTDDLIDTMAVSVGLDIEPGPIEERYQDLVECLTTISHYELDRSRFR